MKFDTIIIGGGLSGLTAGIELSRRGQRCLIVSSGQSALHFFSGSLELLGREDDPFQAMNSLHAGHPYSRIGVDNVRTLASKVQPLFKEVGIDLKGDDEVNHWRITPLGAFKRAWKTMDEYVTVSPEGNIPWKKVCVLDINGFQDFNASYFAAGLAEIGVECVVREVSMPEFDRLRGNPTEMRSTNIAKTLSEDLIGNLASRINEHTNDVEAVLMPAVVGLTGNLDVVRLKEAVDRPLQFLATLPPSVPGIRLQMMLKKHFQKLGGVYMLGDTVTDGEIVEGKLKYIRTSNHGETEFYADNFIIASGSFFSKGLVSDFEGVREPVLGLDVDAPVERAQWFGKNLFETQPYMSFGVITDDEFHAWKGGDPVTNLYAVGSLLGGCNPVKEGSGAGVAVITALYVSELILSHI